MLASWKQSYDKPRQHIKKQRHYIASKGRYSHSFSSSHVWMWELGAWRRLSTKEMMLSNYGVGEDSWESLGLQDQTSQILKEISPWIFIGRTDPEAEGPILWPPDSKTLMLGKIERRRRRGMTEDEMVGWHHRLNGHEFEQALGDGEGQRSLACCSPRGSKELDVTERLNNNKKIISLTLVKTYF